MIEKAIVVKLTKKECDGPEPIHIQIVLQGPDDSIVYDINLPKGQPCSTS